MDGANIVLIETVHGIGVYAFKKIENASAVYKKINKFYEDEDSVHVDFYTPTYKDADNNFNPDTFDWEE